MSSLSTLPSNKPATLKKLTEDHVKQIFSCIHNNTHPPESLMFQIVPVGLEGFKLSPPSYEFEDGLYVLLKPQNSNRNKNVSKDKKQPTPSRIPSNLKSLLVSEDNYRSKECPWSLSGPQFPFDSQFQQRYCYPKGDPAYSKLKGGALWTMYDRENGSEDLEYRLLHVYYSAKRASNQETREGKSSKTLNYQISPIRPTKKKRVSTSKEMETLPEIYPIPCVSNVSMPSPYYHEGKKNPCTNFPGSYHSSYPSYNYGPNPHTGYYHHPHSGQVHPEEYYPVSKNRSDNQYQCYYNNGNYGNETRYDYSSQRDMNLSSRVETNASNPCDQLMPMIEPKLSTASSPLSSSSILPDDFKGDSFDIFSVGCNMSVLDVKGSWESESNSFKSLAKVTPETIRAPTTTLSLHQELSMMEKSLTNKVMQCPEDERKKISEMIVKWAKKISNDLSKKSSVSTDVIDDSKK